MDYSTWKALHKIAGKMRPNDELVPKMGIVPKPPASGVSTNQYLQYIGGGEDTRARVALRKQQLRREQLRRDQLQKSRDTWNKNTKFNMKQMPIVGKGPGQHSASYVNEWWRRWEKYNLDNAIKAHFGSNLRSVSPEALAQFRESERAKHPEWWDRKWVQQQLANSYAQGLQDLKKNTGRFKNYNFWDRNRSILGNLNILGNLGASIFEGPAVDEEWLAKEYKKGRTNDAFQNALLDWRHNAIQGTAAKTLTDMELGLLSGQHVSSSILGGAAGIISKPLQRITGKTFEQVMSPEGWTANDYANEYGRLAEEQYGPDAARRRERWLRTAGAAGRAVGTTGNVIAMGKIMTPIEGALGMAAGSAPVARLGKYVAPVAQMVLGGLSSAASNVPLASTGQGIKAVGDIITLGGKDYEGAKGLVSGAFNVVGDTMEFMPLWGIHSWKYKAPIMGGKLIGAKIPGVRRLVAWLSAHPKIENTAWKSYMWYNLAMRPVMENMGTSMLRNNDVWLTHEDAGKTKAAIDESIKNLETNPEFFKYVQQWLGNSKLTLDEAKKMMPELYTQDLANQSRLTAYFLVDPKFNWMGASQTQIVKHWTSFSPEERSTAKTRSYRALVAKGGPIDYSVFTDPDLTSENRMSLLKLYLMGEDKATGGNLWKQITSSEPKTLARVMGVSSDARQTVAKFMSVELQNMLNGSSTLNSDNISNNGKTDALLNVVLDKLTPEDYGIAVAPLNYATPDQIINLYKSAGATAYAPLKEIAQNTILNRLAWDGNFAGQFIPKWVGAVEDGVGISDESAAMLMSYMKGIVNPRTFIKQMSNDTLVNFERFYLSNKGKEMFGDIKGANQDRWTQELVREAKSRSLGLIWRNPLKYMPIVSELYAKSKGYEGLGNMLGKPIAFYPLLSMLLLGGTWLIGNLISSDDKEEDSGDDKMTNAKLLSKMVKQRELASNEALGF